MDEERPSRDGVPEDFVAFLERRAADLATIGVTDGSAAHGTGLDIAGGLTVNDRDEVLVALARRWWWLRLKARRLGPARAADDLLDRMLVDHHRQWDPTTASLTVGPVRPAARATTVLDRPLSMADLADRAWREALRGRRRLVAGAVGVVVAAVALIAVPRHSEPDRVSAGPSPLLAVTVRPALTDVVPTAQRLADLPPMAVPGLPSRIALSQDDQAVPLSRSPVHRATAIFEPDNAAAILVLGDDGNLRLLDSPLPVNARLTSTSLSPDGTDVALLSDRQLTVVDLISGIVHGYQIDGVQALTTVIWLGPTSVAVSDSSVTESLDLKTGVAGSTRYVAGDLLQAQPPGPLAELISVDDPPGTPARIRHWAADNMLNTSLSPGAGASLLWLGGFQGPGWQCGGMVVRDTATLGLALPLADSPVGVAGAATLAVDEGTGVVRRVLAYPGNPAALAVLGFLDPRTVLLRAGDETAFGILAWRWATGDLHLVAQVDRVAVISLAVR
jgi:hypothetical protein